MPYRAVILTALPIEYMSVRQHLTELVKETHKGTVYERGKFVINNYTWEVGIAQIGAGNAGAGWEAERAITHFNADVALFVGVAGGIKDVKLGDVVAATKVYNYESGKVEKAGVLTRPDIGMSTYAIEQCAKAEARTDNWRTRIIEPKVDLIPDAVPGILAAGEKVISSRRSEVYKFLKRYYGDSLAVEMEGRGFLSATRANSQVEALVIRGISDLINNKKAADEDGWQAIASRNAAAFAFEVLANFIPSRNLAPNNQQTLGSLEIYSKRLKIFNGLREVINICCADGDIPYYRLRQLINNDDEIPKEFLFDEATLSYITEIRSEALSLCAVNARLDERKGQPTEADCTRRTELVIWFSEQLNRVEQQFKKYLQVS